MYWFNFDIWFDLFSQALLNTCVASRNSTEVSNFLRHNSCPKRDRGSVKKSRKAAATTSDKISNFHTGLPQHTMNLQVSSVLILSKQVMEFGRIFIMCDKHEDRFLVPNASP